MITYAIDKANYAELWGLSTDTKPTGYGAVPNGSLFTEIDTGDTYRFNGEAGDWYDGVSKVPTKLEVSSGEYLATYSDNSTDNVTVRIEGDKAVYVYNGMKVSCNAIVVTVTIAVASDTVTYDGEAHTLSAWDTDNGFSISADNSTIFDVSEDVIPKEPNPEIEEKEVGVYPFGIDASFFSSPNDQCIVEFSVTDGGLTIEEASDDDDLVS